MHNILSKDNKTVSGLMNNISNHLNIFIGYNSTFRKDHKNDTITYNCEKIKTITFVVINKQTNKVTFTDKRVRYPKRVWFIL